MSVDMVKNLKAKLHLPNWTGSMRIPKKQIEQFSEDDLLSIEEKVKRRWVSAYHELSLSLEILQMINNVKILQEGATLFEAADLEKEDLLIEFIMSLTSATEVNPVIINSIRENLKEYVENGEGVLHEKFHDFLVNQSATAKFVNILKCLSLDILSPVINSIHAKVYDKYPYKNSSQLKVLIQVTNSIYEVTITQTEKSVNDVPDQTFNFTWEAKVVFDQQVGVDGLKVKVNVVAIEFHETMKSRTKRDIRELFEPFIDQVGAYRLLWSRDLLRLPVHKDIARLSKNLIIADANNKILYEDPEQKFPGRYSVNEILRVIATAMNDTPVLRALDSFGDYVKGQGDLSEHILKFFHLPAFSQDSPTVKILKCISQEMIYPAVQTIRTMLYEKYPYKDVKGGWYVKVILDHGNLRIIHSKREQNHSENSSAIFEFQWVLQLTFDPKMETIHPTLNIIDFDWGNQVSVETKADITDLVFSLIDSDTMYKQIVSKSLEQLPVINDLIEIYQAEGFEIIEEETGAIIFESKRDKDISKHIFKFLRKLVGLLETKKIKELFKKEYKKYLKNDSPQEALKQFFQSNILPSNCNTIKVLKSLRSEIVSPAYRKLRRAFPQNLPISSIEGSWSAKIVVGEKNITICHSKREQGTEGQNFGSFDFQWLLSLSFDKQMNVISSDLKIVNYSWDTFLKKDTKSLLLKIWAPYVEWHGIDSQQSPIAESSDFCYLNATDLLKSVCATLERQPEHLLNPEQADQLRSLLEVLKTVDVPLVVVPS